MNKDQARNRDRQIGITDWTRRRLSTGVRRSDSLRHRPTASRSQCQCCCRSHLLFVNLIFSSSSTLHPNTYLLVTLHVLYVHQAWSTQCTPCDPLRGTSWVQTTERRGGLHCQFYLKHSWYGDFTAVSSTWNIAGTEISLLSVLHKT